MITMPENEYLTIQEVCKVLKVSRITVYRWIKSGKLSAYKAGKQYRIEKSHLDNFVKGGK